MYRKSQLTDQPQIQSKSLLRLRLRVLGHPWPAPSCSKKRVAKSRRAVRHKVTA